MNKREHYLKRLDFKGKKISKNSVVICYDKSLGNAVNKRELMINHLGLVCRTLDAIEVARNEREIEFNGLFYDNFDLEVIGEL